ncbi:MAG: hypothetical protein LBF28_01295 [Rickettsiales bacterium]|jgi:hypothetical protein|nr:hypothetical protein [Rickettsiales bacterium]
MLDATNIFGRKNIISGKLWLLGISALLGLGKAPAQNVLQNSINKQESHTSVATESVPIRADSLCTNAGYATAKLSLDSINISKLMGLPIGEFLGAIKSAGPKTDIDIITKMPAAERAKYMAAAKNRPLRVEADTIFIKTMKDFENLSSLIAYIDGLKLIRLAVFESEPDATEQAAEYCKILNKEIKFMFSHEYKHFLDCSLDITGLAPQQLGVFVLQLEITARLNEIMDRRTAFILTGKITEAFPRELNYLNSKLKNKSDFDSLFSSTNPRGKNPLEHHTVRHINMENKEYLKWLFNNRGNISTDSISAEENAVIFTAALRNANKEYAHYFKNGQIDGMMREIVIRQNTELLKRHRAVTRAASLGDSMSYTAPTFASLINDLYTINIESLPADVQFVYSSMLQKLYEIPDFQKTMHEIKKKYTLVLENTKTIQQLLYGDKPLYPQKFDISDKRNKRFSFSENDIEKISKILHLER